MGKGQERRKRNIQEMENMIIIMVINMKENGKMEKSMEMENMIIIMVINMKENGKMEKEMEKEH